MDRFVYNYHTLGGQPSNRLNYVVDNGTDYSAYDDIKSGQATGNYTYNKIGELIEDTQEDMILHWRTGDHKLSKIERTDDDSPQLEFFYNPFGQRTMKVEKPRVSGVIQANSTWKYTYYAYDANGQVMAVYSGNFQGTSEQVKLSEQHLYGAERLGMINRNVVMFDNGVTSYTHKEEDVVHEDERGRKRYELHGHTNSVLAVISDRKMYNSVDGNYEPVMISWADYYCFGMLQPDRNGSANSELYRYGMNGMEMDNEVSGNGNSYDFGARMYNPRLGRWFTTDKVIQPERSSYSAMHNNPIMFIDPDGNDVIIGYWRKKDRDKFVADLRGITGLDVYIDKNNRLQVRPSDGNVVRPSEYDKTQISSIAAGILIEMIEAECTEIIVHGYRGEDSKVYSMGDDDRGIYVAEINIDPEESEQFYDNWKKRTQEDISDLTRKLAGTTAMKFFHEGHHVMTGSRDERDMGTPSPDADLYGDERSASGIQPGSAADFENSILSEMGLMIRATYSITFGNKKIIPYTKPSRENIDGALDKFKRSEGNPTRFPEKMDRTEFEPKEKRGNKKNETKSQDNDRDYKKHPKSKSRI